MLGLFSEKTPSLDQSNDPVAKILGQPLLSIRRQMEMKNMMFGVDQANTYTISDSNGHTIGHLVERSGGVGKFLQRDLIGADRPFTVDLVDTDGNVLLSIRRNYKLTRSHVKVLRPMNGDMVEIGECSQKWNPLKKKYTLSENGHNFGYASSGIVISHNFPVKDDSGHICAAITRDWSNIVRQMVVDSPTFVVRMHPTSLKDEDFGEVSKTLLTLNQKAILLALVVSIDFDHLTKDKKDDDAGK